MVKYCAKNSPIENSEQATQRRDLFQGWESYFEPRRRGEVRILVEIATQRDLISYD